MDVMEERWRWGHIGTQGMSQHCGAKVGSRQTFKAHKERLDGLCVIDCICSGDIICCFVITSNWGCVMSTSLQGGSSLAAGVLEVGGGGHLVMMLVNDFTFLNTYMQTWIH
jgi:hypothetical protein